VLLLSITVTPADRGGRPLLADWLEARLESLGVWQDKDRLKGENPLAMAAITSEDIEPRFIVRFETNSDAGRALRIFRENRGKGRTLFNDWASQDDAFAGFDLATMTPAGEAVLAYKQNIPSNQSNRKIRALTEALNMSTAVVYADPYPFYPFNGQNG